MIIENGPAPMGPAASRKFFVAFVFQGERYGLNKGLTHNDRVPLIEFYDATYLGDPKFDDPRGQFVARYYVNQFSRPERAAHGLDLVGHEPAWKVDARAMRAVVDTCMAICDAMDIPPSQW